MACGKERSATTIDSFADALLEVNASLEDFAAMNPNAATIQQDGVFQSFAAIGSDWTTGLVRLPDSSNTDVSIKEYMGKQLDPDAVGDGGGGQEFALNIFGRFNNATMIGCALMTLSSNISSSTGYPAAGSETMTLTAENLTTLQTSCGMSASDAAFMTSVDPDPAIAAVIEIPTDTTYYDRKVTMTLPASMGGATQYFYFRYNSDEINILDMEDGTFDSRTMVSMNLSTRVLKVE